ncbi:MAG: hypothetical protein E6K86_11715 [Thaumarchaeota archaeon]|nr:MAG: hypothetical protein E6K86_11715 [Nitrososphaerota archaeon]
MKRYVLIKEYNPAYDFWLRAHLKEKRIMGDREYSWKEAQQILIDLDERGRTDEFFQSHFLAWRDHPEYPPAYLYLLRLILPIYAHGEIDLGKMAQLDREARIRHQRILFSLDDAASDFYDFYAKVITQPLERDLERGASGRTLSNYFEFEEFGRLPDVRVVGLETVEKAVHKVAVELLRQLQKITLDKILCDTRITLDQHYDRGMTEATSERTYIHTSEFVRLMIQRSSGPSDPATVILCPARGHGVIREGYEGVFYPTYYVQEMP